MKLLYTDIRSPVLTKSAASVDESFNLERNQLIAAIMSQQLSSRHFSRTPLDDALSRKIYDLYLNQLDPRKRFLLQEDVRKLDSFRERIDDELRRGGFRLPDAGRQLLNARIREADRVNIAGRNKGFLSIAKIYCAPPPAGNRHRPDAG